MLAHDFSKTKPRDRSRHPSLAFLSRFLADDQAKEKDREGEANRGGIQHLTTFLAPKKPLCCVGEPTKMMGM